MTVGGLFSGVGGFELGLQLAGFDAPSWMVEADPWRRSVLSKHWPEAEVFYDVRTVGALRGLRPVDVIVGGFPCQDISTAGKGAGLSGERSGLWFEMLRIISELRPRGVIVENSNGGRGRWLPEAIRGLRGLGYRVRRPLVISAAMCGAPHVRARCFLIAVADGDEFGGYARKGRRPSEAGAGRELDGLCLGGEAVGYSAQERLATNLFNATRARIEPGAANTDSSLGNGQDCGRERGLPGGAQGTLELQPGANPGGQHSSGVEEERREPFALGNQREMERAPYGVPYELDRLPAGCQGWDPFRFPVGQGPRQHEWEPPRVVRNFRWRKNTPDPGPGYRGRNWTKRVEATGDAVVPAVAYLAALALLDWMDGGKWTRNRMSRTFEKSSKPWPIGSKTKLAKGARVSF